PAATVSVEARTNSRRFISTSPFNQDGENPDRTPTGEQVPPARQAECDDVDRVEQMENPDGRGSALLLRRELPKTAAGEGAELEQEHEGGIHPQYPSAPEEIERRCNDDEDRHDDVDRRSLQCVHELYVPFVS